MSFDPDKPYSGVALLPPKAELKTKTVLRKAIGGNKTLAELNGAGDLIPNQSVLISATHVRETNTWRYSRVCSGVILGVILLLRANNSRLYGAIPLSRQISGRG